MISKFGVIFKLSNSASFRMRPSNDLQYVNIIRLRIVLSFRINISGNLLKGFSAKYQTTFPRSAALTAICERRLHNNKIQIYLSNFPFVNFRNHILSVNKQTKIDLNAHKRVCSVTMQIIDYQNVKDIILLNFTSMSPSTTTEVSPITSTFFGWFESMPIRFVFNYKKLITGVLNQFKKTLKCHVNRQFFFSLNSLLKHG